MPHAIRPAAYFAVHAHDPAAPGRCSGLLPHAARCRAAGAVALAVMLGVLPAGCAESASPAADDVARLDQPVGVTPLTSTSSARPETPMPDLAAAVAALIRSTGLQPVLIRTAKDDPSVAAAVAYRPEDGGTPVECALMVFATDGDDATTVETSTELVGCSADAPVDGLAEAVELDVQATRIGLFQQHTRSNDRFELARRADGRWVVASATFTFPEYDADTDEMRVFTESVAYPAGARKIPVSDYRRALIAPDLERHEIQ